MSHVTRKRHKRNVTQSTLFPDWVGGPHFTSFSPWFGKREFQFSIWIPLVATSDSSQVPVRLIKWKVLRTGNTYFKKLRWMEILTAFWLVSHRHAFRGFDVLLTPSSSLFIKHNCCLKMLVWLSFESRIALTVTGLTVLLDFSGFQRMLQKCGNKALLLFLFYG